MFPNLPSLLNVVLLSLVAGLGTGVGGLVAILLKPGKRSFGFLMGIASGVMITLSFLELVNEAWELAGVWTATIGFGAGAVFMFLLTTLLRTSGLENRKFAAQRLRKGSRFHQFTGDGVMAMEGGCGKTRLQTAAYLKPVFCWQLESPFIISRKALRLGLASCIPRNLVCSLHWQFCCITSRRELPQPCPFAPVVYANGNPAGCPALRHGRTDWCAGSCIIIKNFLRAHSRITGVCRGVMMFITLDELIPAAREHGHQHYTAIGIILGAIFVFLLSGIFGV